MTAESVGTIMTWKVGGVRAWLDRMLSVGYAAVCDSLDPRLGHDQRLQTEVRDLVEAAVPAHAQRRDVRVLEIDCGPARLACALAEAGFTVTGLDAYAALVGAARGKRRALHLANLDFRCGDLTRGNTFRDGAFDQVVSLHALSGHPAPERLLREAHRVLKPGGHAVFVIHPRRAGSWTTLREIGRRDGSGAALQWLLRGLVTSIFEAARERVPPPVWNETTWSAQVRGAGFAVLAMRKTFLGGASLLVWAKKDAESS
jgi:SAM-dependent methyltransferase